ncbi:1-acyl-sn-glycerol-3-phosphate acyltransferase [uncultured Anaerococcus sp.]|mgnify:FL=1|uniref:lysophospholipid acyltransferase family protein n=1 Tax=uncultured Anaerococcus sp. TaxID=293428 RepID=UPI00261E4AA4|nr:lysophospholipid acyltransferase family protein [uncultured Anaerococcus sp.]
MFYRVVAAILRVLFFPFFRIRVHGRENIPDKSDIIVCANHWSNLDPIFLAISLPIKFKFMAKKELFEISILKNILKALGAFPINRQGSDLKSLRYAIGLIKDGETLGIFPEGTRVKEISRDNMHEGVGFIALKAKADILPIEIKTSYKIFSRVDIYVKNPIEIEKYAGIKNKVAMNQISDEIFEKIYENTNILEREANANN